MENYNMLHHPIKFSIKTNDLEKLKKKPDKLFTKLDLKENDFDKISSININRIIDKRFLEDNLLVTENANKSIKRTHEKEFEEVLSKHKKIEGNLKVLIEPETPSTLVIRALPHSVMPPVITKEQSILQIFSKNNKDLTEKLTYKNSEIERSSKDTSELLVLSKNKQLTFNEDTDDKDRIFSKLQSPKINDEKKILIMNDEMNYYKIIDEKKYNKIDKTKNIFDKVQDKSISTRNKEKSRSKKKNEKTNSENIKERIKYKSTKDNSLSVTTSQNLGIKLESSGIGKKIKLEEIINETDNINKNTYDKPSRDEKYLIKEKIDNPAIKGKSASSHNKDRLRLKSKERPLNTENKMDVKHINKVLCSKIQDDNIHLDKEKGPISKYHCRRKCSKSYEKLNEISNSDKKKEIKNHRSVNEKKNELSYSNNNKESADDRRHNKKKVDILNSVKKKMEILNLDKKKDSKNYYNMNKKIEISYCDNKKERADCRNMNEKKNNTQDERLNNDNIKFSNHNKSSSVENKKNSKSKTHQDKRTTPKHRGRRDSHNYYDSGSSRRPLKQSDQYHNVKDVDQKCLSRQNSPIMPHTSDSKEHHSKPNLPLSMITSETNVIHLITEGCRLVNPEDHLEESFNYTNKTVEFKDKKNIREKLQKFLDKKKLTEEFGVCNLKLLNEESSQSCQNIPKDICHLNITSMDSTTIPQVSYIPSNKDLTSIDIPHEVTENKSNQFKEFKNKSLNYKISPHDISLPQEFNIHDNTKNNKSSNESVSLVNTESKILGKQLNVPQVSKSNDPKISLMIPLPEVPKSKTFSSEIQKSNSSQKDSLTKTEKVKNHENQSTKTKIKHSVNENFVFINPNKKNELRQSIETNQSQQAMLNSSDDEPIRKKKLDAIIKHCDTALPNNDLPQIIDNKESSLKTQSNDIKCSINLQRQDQKNAEKSIIMEHTKSINISFKIKTIKKPSLNVFDNIEVTKESQFDEDSLFKCIPHTIFPGEISSSGPKCQNLTVITKDYLLDNCHSKNSILKSRNIINQSLNEPNIEHEFLGDNNGKKELEKVEKKDNIKKEESINLDNTIINYTKIDSCQKTSDHKDAKDLQNVDILKSIMDVPDILKNSSHNFQKNEMIHDEFNSKFNSIVEVVENLLEESKSFEITHQQELPRHVQPQKQQILECEQISREINLNKLTKSFQNSKTVIEKSKNMFGKDETNNCMNEKYNIFEESFEKKNLSQYQDLIKNSILYKDNERNINKKGINEAQSALKEYYISQNEESLTKVSVTSTEDELTNLIMPPVSELLDPLYNSVYSLKKSLLLDKGVKDSLEPSKVIVGTLTSQAYRSKVKHLRNHSNRSKSKDEVKNDKKKMREIDDKDKERKSNDQKKLSEIQKYSKDKTKLKEIYDESKVRKKSKDLYEHEYKLSGKYIQHNDDTFKAKIKDNKGHYRSRSKHRSRDNKKKWDCRSSSERSVTRKIQYDHKRQDSCSDYKYKSRDRNRRKSYRSQSKCSRKSRSLSHRKLSTKNKHKLRKITKYDSSESESRRRCKHSQDKHKSRKGSNNYVNSTKMNDKECRYYRVTKSRSNSRKKTDDKFLSNKKCESNHRWKSSLSDGSGTPSRKCDPNVTKCIIQNQSKIKSKSLLKCKDKHSDSVIVTEVPQSGNKAESFETNDNNVDVDRRNIYVENSSVNNCDMSLKQLSNIDESNNEKIDTNESLKENEISGIDLSNEMSTVVSTKEVLENKHNLEHDLKVKELAEQYINSILSLFSHSTTATITDISRNNADLNSQRNYPSPCISQPDIVYNNQTFTLNTVNTPQTNNPCSHSFPVYHQPVPFNNYSFPNIYQPSYYNVYNTLQYYNLPSLQSANIFTGRVNMNSYFQPDVKPQPVQFNSNDNLSISSQWNFYNSEIQEKQMSYYQSQQPIYSQDLRNYDASDVPNDDLLRSSKSNSHKNSVIDMNIGSPSLGSIDSINDLKLDDIISDKDDLSSCGGFDFDDVEPQDPFQKYPDAPRPKYEHIVKTEVHSSALGKRFDYAYLKSTSCNCVPPNPDEIRMGKAACDENCFNRKIKVECNRRCPVYDLCTNRRFQEQIYGPIEPFFSGENKGWGVRALSNIPSGTFVIEYVGELIDFKEFLSRISQESLYSNHFLMVIQKDMYLDAGNKGNWARFVNHSCDPNAMIERWVVGGKTRIGFFSKKPILKDEEITIDYQFQQYGSIEQKCYCGSINCTGIMGKVNEKLQEQIKCSELRYRKELIQRIIARKSLKEINHVSEMITVIKENCLDRDTFFSFLEVLLRSNSSQCIRTFIECGGLNVITSYLDTISWNDWALKLLYLQCLVHFKLKKRILLNSGYTSVTVVDYWAQNPRYILKHLAEDSLDIDSFDDDNDTINESSEPTAVDNESSIQFSLPNAEEPILEIEKQVQCLALKIKDYFNQEKAKFFIPKIKSNQIEFSTEFSTNDSESKSISIASSIQGDFIQNKTKKLQNRCTEAIQKLSKDEFRRLFSERYYKSIVEKSQASTSNDCVIKNNEVFQKIKQLLSNVIIEEITNLKQNEQFYTMPQEFQNLDIDKILSNLNIEEYDDILPLLNPLLDDQSKPSSLSKSLDDISKCDESTSSIQSLPPDWRFCRCENGRIYFYHVITKKTQWEKPVYPWDAGEDDPYSYNFGNAQDYQITADDIKLMHQIRKNKYKEDKLQEREKKRIERKLNLSVGDRNKIQFSREVFKVVKIIMKPYFSSSCKVGRVRSKVDLKFLCEKFAETIITKEVKLVANLEDLELNSDVSSRITSYIKKYMSSHGRNFNRSKKFKSDESKPPNTDSIYTDSPNLSL